MFSTDDTIVAVATPPGRGGIGVVRISGPAAHEVASSLLERATPLQPRYATFTRLRSSAPTPADEVIATLFPSPRSYTGQDVVEISTHGSPVILEGVLRSALSAGARLAEPGEFTLRAFLNGRRDLVQAEAVGDLIAAVTPAQARVAFDQLTGTLTRRIAGIDARLFDLIAKLEASLDFGDEGYHFVEPGEVARTIDEVVTEVDALINEAAVGRLLREGATVVLCGRPNVGKSSLFNRLVGSERAIVTDVPGTTRDLISEVVDVHGVPVTFVDTAGTRETTDPIERAGVDRSAGARRVADLVLLVLDASEALTADDARLLAEIPVGRRLVVFNKADLGRPVTDRILGDAVVVSALAGDGVDHLIWSIDRKLMESQSPVERPAISNIRHIELMRQARTDLDEARCACVVDAAPEEFVLTGLQRARMTFDEVVGKRTTEDILAKIFERFCIGK